MWKRLLCLAGVGLLLAGCASYTTPGRAADLEKLGLTEEAKAAMTDTSVQRVLDKRPLVTFPASIAVARVQAADYDSYSYHRFRPAGGVGPVGGAYSVITKRDIEKDEDFAALTQLPQVAGVAGIKRILLDRTLNSDLELRSAAAELHANLLLYYTLDTAFDTQTHVAPLGLITLGIFPNMQAKVTCTASAVLMDVSNGYIYSVAEATAMNDQLANAWTSEEAMDEARRKTERQAFEQLLGQFKIEWTNVIVTYNRPPGIPYSTR